MRNLLIFLSTDNASTELEIPSYNQDYLVTPLPDFTLFYNS